MNVGITLPNLGPAAGPDLAARFARRAEEIGYSTLWVADRLLYPVKPRSPYPGTPDGSLPDFYRCSLDPLLALTWAAAHTSRIELGTGILQFPLHNPVVTARGLTTLDILSGGRVVAGFGQGWSVDEFEAAGTLARDRGDRAEEFLRVLQALWGEPPAQFQGRHFRLAPSIVARPVRRPPVLLAAYAPKALERVALLADGWLPVGVPLPTVKIQWDGILQAAAEAGRDPSRLQLRVAGFVMAGTEIPEQNRSPFTGSPAQIAADIQAVRELGAHELCIQYLPQAPDGADAMEALEQLWQLAS